MKLIIAGSRTLSFDLIAIQNFIDNLIPMDIEINEIVCGMTRGIDISGLQYAEFQSISVTKFPADWDLHGKSAGPKRNKEMAEYADALLLIWDGESKGSANMKKNMLDLKKPVYEVILKVHNK